MDADSKKKILIVDDEAAVTEMVKAHLEGTGRFEVLMVNDGKRAVEKARHFKPRLIILDEMIPGSSGGEILAELKADKDLKEVPVVFLTAIVTKDETCDDGGVIAGHPFMAKPIIFAELVGFVDKHIQK